MLQPDRRAMPRQGRGLALVALGKTCHLSTHGTTDMERYSHVVEVDEATRELIIHRIYADGRREFLTRTKLPAAASAGESDHIGTFAKFLGENLLLDSPVARKLLGL